MVSAVINTGKNIWDISNIGEDLFKSKSLPSKEEIEEFYKLLDAARKFDKKVNQPDCEREELKTWLIEFNQMVNKKINEL